MKTLRIPKPTFWSAVFWILLFTGLYATIVRFAYGLGAATNLSDSSPWGLWIGFDVLCGVGLAAGGFVVAGSVHIFNIHRFKAILPSAILTAFLGYLLVIVALLFDLGRPWYIWHALIMWNPHSVMFEVAWCVMLYTTVLALEFSPLVFEKLRLERPRKIIRAVTIPLVIIGVILSTLHQSSLGSLYLIVPTKLHPLWYTSNLPYLFLLSAIAVGPAMVTIESFYSSRAFRREIELPILSQLGKVTVAAMAVYAVLRVQDMIAYQLWSYLLIPSMESAMFWLEMLLGVALPIIVLLQTRFRTNARGLFIAQLCVVFGFILNRMNISVTALAHQPGVEYFPSWMEMTVTLMIVAVGFAAFRLAAKHLRIFPEETKPVPTPAQSIVTFIDVPSTHEALAR